MNIFKVCATFEGGAVCSTDCETLDEARNLFRGWRREGAERILVHRMRGTNGDDRVHSTICDWKRAS